MNDVQKCQREEQEHARVRKQQPLCSSFKEPSQPWAPKRETAAAGSHQIEKQKKAQLLYLKDKDESNPMDLSSCVSSSLPDFLP